ncbi:MAG: hypothetical protein KAS13_09180, partial [Candidatus Omnitrophica bacterium]|nr:hypothetical protein [Candidatus Omnitrophota bacterium]
MPGQILKAETDNRKTIRLSAKLYGGGIATATEDEDFYQFQTVFIFKYLPQTLPFLDDTGIATATED